MALAPTKAPVKTYHTEYTKFSGKWRRCCDVYDGQDAVHNAGQLYLPKLTGQDDSEYKAYKERAVFFNATYRTITGLQGMMFRKPYQIDVPESVLPLLDDVNMAGMPLSIFMLEVSEHALKIGRLGVLVDHPAGQVGATMADAQRLNLRPTMTMYDAVSIINWHVGVINNQRVPTMIVLQEEVTITGTNEFEESCKPQWRVLDLNDSGVYRQRIFMINDQGEQIQVGADIIPLMNNQPLAFIPFYFIGVDDTDCDIDDPPLIDLVNMNLSHYRTVADYEHGCHFTGLPQPYVTGVTLGDGEVLTIGSSKAWTLPNPQSTAGYVALDSGFVALENNLKRKEHMMAILGARMLEEQPRAVETAEAARLHSAGESSMLATIARSISLGIQRTLQTFTNWAGVQNYDVAFQINRDFVPAKMQPQELTALVSAWQLGAFSKETLFINLQKGEIIADDAKFEDEQILIDEEQTVIADRQLKNATAQAQAQADLMASRQSNLPLPT
jgi:hypothetical protein